MNYEQKYKEALKNARVFCKDEDRHLKATIERIFPELKESDDEKIRKSLVILLQHFCKGYRVPGLELPVSFSDMLAWLEKQKETSTSLKDGIYLCYSDGHHELFTGENPKENVAYIGIVQGERKLKVALHDVGEYPLTNEYAKDDYEGYFDSRIDAMADWGMEKNMEHLRAQGLPYTLNEGEYVPTLGQLMFILLHLRDVNKALEYAGGEPFKEDYYWSSTESYTVGTWGVDFSNGIVTIIYKDYSFVIRAVAAF